MVGLPGVSCTKTRGLYVKSWCHLCDAAAAPALAAKKTGAPVQVTVGDLRPIVATMNALARRVWPWTVFLSAWRDKSIQLIYKESTMTPEVPLLASQLVVRICLFLVAAIAMFGGALQMYLGQPDTSPRLDNVHRFMAGVYFSTGLISLWAAVTIRQQGILVYLLALGVFLAGVGRLVSISKVGLPEPAAVWLGYLIPELLLPIVIVVAHRGGH
ncbi:DUF4345 domain-containing protein [Polaromonas sp. UC242_47]|uniref:DUF4345 domain-containing protein n=1 Tax=Polaromonas sp. UC242_47 TaxID=3374626 RepID=UPI003789D4CB